MLLFFNVLFVKSNFSEIYLFDLLSSAHLEMIFSCLLFCQLQTNSDDRHQHWPTCCKDPGVFKQHATEVSLSVPVNDYYCLNRLWDSRISAAHTCTSHSLIIPLDRTRPPSQGVPLDHLFPWIKAKFYHPWDPMDFVTLFRTLSTQNKKKGQRWRKNMYESGRTILWN